MKYLVTDVLHRKNNNLDFVRLWLAFAVIIGHIPVFIAGHTPRPIINSLFPFTYCGNVAVVAFFFFSGLLVTNSLFTKQNVKQYVTSRLIRILPVYLFVIIGAALLCFFASSETSFFDYLPNAWAYIKKMVLFPFNGNGIDMINTVSFLREGHPMDGKFATAINGSLWIIPYEMRLYGILLALFWVCKMMKEKGQLIVTMFFIAGIFSPFLFSQQLFGGTNPETLYLIPCFSFGGLLALYKDYIYFDYKMPALLFLLGIAFRTHEISHLFYFLALCTSCLYISTLPVIKKINIKIDISYGVYCWGWVVQQFVQYFFYPYLNYYTYALSCITLATVMGLISYYGIEKPTLKLKGMLDK